MKAPLCAEPFLCGQYFDRLKQERYDIVRDTERFKAVLGKITPYVDDTAKQN